MTYTVEQIRAAVEDVSEEEALKFPSDGREVSWTNHLVYDYPVTDWSEMGYSNGRIVIDGEAVDYEAVEDIGGEGQGEYAAVIFKVGDQMFRKEGYYASHYGTEWDGPLEEVEAYQKTVTDYRPVS